MVECEFGTSYPLAEVLKLMLDDVALIQLIFILHRLQLHLQDSLAQHFLLGVARLAHTHQVHVQLRVHVLLFLQLVA